MFSGEVSPSRLYESCFLYVGNNRYLHLDMTPEGHFHEGPSIHNTGCFVAVIHSTMKTNYFKEEPFISAGYYLNKNFKSNLIG